MSEWQPIETAPKNTESVLIVSRGKVGEAWYSLREEKWIWAYSLSVQTAPTHWMPLPEPPK